MRRLLSLLAIIIPGCLMLVLAVGCTITAKNSGQMGLRFGTDIAFYSSAAQTAPEPATLKSEFPSVESWIFRPKPEDVIEEPKPVPVATSTTTTTTTQPVVIPVKP